MKTYVGRILLVTMILLPDVARSGGGPVCISEQQKVTGSNTEIADHVGRGLSSDGSFMIAGNYADDHAGLNSGSAYVFIRLDGGTPTDPADDVWVEQAKLTALDAAPIDFFGISVSIQGYYCAVGAPLNDELGQNAGAVYVFYRLDNGTPTDFSDDTWVQQAKLMASDAAGGDEFGYSISMDGEFLIVGSAIDDAPFVNSGSSFIFRRLNAGTPSDPSDDMWIQQAKLTASDGAPGDLFGNSVAIHGDSCIVGAPLDDAPSSDSGSAYIFRRMDNGTPADDSDDFWVQETKLTAADASSGDYFGWSVSIDDSYAIVGAVNDDEPAYAQGTAFVFRHTPSASPSWVQQAKLTPANPGTGGNFGQSVAINGDYALIGDDTAASGGAAHLFHRQDGGTPGDPIDDSWQEIAKLTASDPQLSGSFGNAVAMSDPWLLVGAFDAVQPPPIGRTGAVYVFWRDALPPTICGDGCCSGDETCASCIQDCLLGCGDGCCSSAVSETSCSCPIDCGAVCGDGCCTSSFGESCSTCPQDCSYCGDGCCLGSENAGNCSSDCDSCCDPQSGICTDSATPASCLPPLQLRGDRLCSEFPPCGLLVPGCGECRLYGDVADYYSCVVDLDDLLCMLSAFQNMASCPRADIYPCAPASCKSDAECTTEVTGPICVNGGCRCTSIADCAAFGAVCNPYRQGGRCELVDIDDLVGQLNAISGNDDCPPPCPPGACLGDFTDDGTGNPTCRDGNYAGSFFVGSGMSESDCFILTEGTGTYCGDYSYCTSNSNCAPP